MDYYNEEELAIRIREIRDSKNFLSKREDELIHLWGIIQGTGKAVSERGMVYGPKTLKEKPAKEKFTIPRKNIHVPLLKKISDDKISLELLDEMADREAAER